MSSYAPTVWIHDNWESYEPTVSFEHLDEISCHDIAGVDGGSDNPQDGKSNGDISELAMETRAIDWPAQWAKMDAEARSTKLRAWMELKKARVKSPAPAAAQKATRNSLGGANRLQTNRPQATGHFHAPPPSQNTSVLDAPIPSPPPPPRRRRATKPKPPQPKTNAESVQKISDPAKAARAKAAFTSWCNKKATRDQLEQQHATVQAAQGAAQKAMAAASAKAAYTEWLARAPAPPMQLRPRMHHWATQLGDISNSGVVAQKPTFFATFPPPPARRATTAQQRRQAQLGSTGNTTSQWQMDGKSQVNIAKTAPSACAPPPSPYPEHSPPLLFSEYARAQVKYPGFLKRYPEQVANGGREVGMVYVDPEPARIRAETSKRKWDTLKSTVGCHHVEQGSVHVRERERWAKERENMDCSQIRLGCRKLEGAGVREVLGDSGAAL
ncbi:hypothetical protein BC828DRAFT_371693 [Blastocladiella britannica]|nr:hypothetical protein BC828DRAFT_371693 [Blastocladiella britannica]